MESDKCDQPADLVVLTADKDAEEALLALLNRPRDLGVRTIDLLPPVRAPRHDPEVLRRSQEYLRPYLRGARHALVVFDRDGCGSTASRTVIESEVEQRLSQNGWGERSAAVVIDPELEIWVWGDLHRVSLALRWPQGTALQRWLVSEGYLKLGQTKPRAPKEAFDRALKLVRNRHSSSIFRRLAGVVSFEKCADPAFLKLQATLQRWFPAT